MKLLLSAQNRIDILRIALDTAKVDTPIEFDICPGVVMDIATDYEEYVSTGVNCWNKEEENGKHNFTD